ncbi:MAG TPA: hypothetical protein VK662_15610 [Acidothermaceae bacterium]|jgi:hypothetical protein|nr:hypothetical protein [Acidothermaceae bacterium]
MSELGAERVRLRQTDKGEVDWRRWGTYLSERAWGSVREDYSADGDAWANFPFDHARSRTYRWNEDGLAGFCDSDQTWCFALAMWNGQDQILKERLFGLTNSQGNHGEDVKERYWFVDGTPTHSWMRWRYHYPQLEFPYEQLLTENARRTRLDPEYEIDDTGAFAGDKYFDVTVDYAKAAADDLCVRITVHNPGLEAATIELLPTLWFRNTWSWGLPKALPAPRITCQGAALVAVHQKLGTLTLTGTATPEFVESVACDNETNSRLLYGEAGPPYPKDGIGDHVITGAATVNPDGFGTKAALRYRLSLAPGETREVRLRLQAGNAAADLGNGFDAVMTARQLEADAFYAGVPAMEIASADPPGISAGEAAIVRQAIAGLLWSKQFYHYDVERWLEGDPAGPPPPPGRGDIRNGRWLHLNNHDVLLMPDSWEYPWYASWDLAFHCVVIAQADPEFAKQQLLLLLREWYMHPNGQLPAYEWNFADVNPPVHAWAALRVFEVSGETDYDFLERAFHKLLLNFTWWVNQEDHDGNNLFQGGFLGLDNIGPFDRSRLSPDAGELEQSDGTAWMAMYCLDLLDMALVLATHDSTYEDVATKFFEHFAHIATAAQQQGLWDDTDGFFYDQLRMPDGERVPIKVRSLVGLIAVCAVSHVDNALLTQLPGFASRLRWFTSNRPALSHCVVETADDDTMFAMLDPGQLRRLLSRMFDEAEFYSPHGIRSISAYHRDHPFEFTLDGQYFRVDYEPGESSTGLFGGNSNWRGPVWMPLNALLVEALQRFDKHLGKDFLIEVPTGSGHEITLGEAADQLSGRLIGLLLADGTGHIPASASRVWPEGLLWFHEYFHGDTGEGLGASHQTGWTSLLAHLVLTRHQVRRAMVSTD